MRTLIKGGHIVNENQCFEGSLLIDNDTISRVFRSGETPRDNYDRCVDVTGCFVFPGVIDTHVHFREPGMTHKADIASESKAAAYGGVTSFFDMPNTNPATVTLDNFKDKLQRAAARSHINYAFFFGATNDNHATFQSLDATEIPGIKLFMGSSTGNMLVDKYGALLKIFAEAARCHLPVVAHCEDSATIEANMQTMQKVYGDDPDVALHPLIRSEEACYESASLAVQLAKTYGTQLHIAHISTAKELSLFMPSPPDSNDTCQDIHPHIPTITAEAAIPHLLFSSNDYATLGTRIKCNPAIKGEADRNELRKALTDGRISTIATDHAPHLIDEKRGGCRCAASGMPMVQFSLISMLQLADTGVVSLERIAQLMCHAPAQLFNIRKRGFIREGYKADLAIVSRCEAWTLTANDIRSRCGWSPLEGRQFAWKVRKTVCNGNMIYDDGMFDNNSRGEKILFR